MMTKGDIYTKEIFQKILDKGCLDLNPRPHYEDEYVGAGVHTITFSSSKKAV